MSLERANPIPPGTYWYDIMDRDASFWGARPNLELFKRWALANEVTILSVEERHLGAWLDPNKDVHSWVSFRLDKPTPRWTTLPGFPTRGEEATREDTVKRAPPEGVAEYWGLPQFDSKMLGPGLIALGVLWWLSRK